MIYLTMRELTQHYELKKRLEDEEKMLMLLEAAAYPKPALDGMPRAPGLGAEVGDLAADIADIRDHICSLRGEVERDEERVADFIDTIEAAYIRTILRLRFIRCLTWKEVARTIGGRNTSDGVRMACYRYLNKRSRQE